MVAQQKPRTTEVEPIGADEGLGLLVRALRDEAVRPIEGPILLAVSGGPDSMAMLFLAASNKENLRRIGVEVHVATVDHALRLASADEAATVAGEAARLGLPHRTLRWMGPKPTSNLQEAARRARYALLSQAAEAIGATAVLTAHHEDDQIETHLLAKARGAGDRGLAGMRPRRALAPGIDLLRPFLDVPASRLRATAEASGLRFFDDPSNRDIRHARARIRLARSFATPDERAESIAAIARHRSVREAADHALARALAGVEVDGFGRVRLARAELDHLLPELRAELLGRIIAAVAGLDHPPLRRDLGRLAERLSAEGSLAATLGGAQIEAGASILVAREFGRQGPTSVPLGPPKGRALFDGRFDVSSSDPDLGTGLHLVAFGTLGRGNAAERTMPVLLDRDGTLVAVPASLVQKAPGVAGRIACACRIGWRLRADLPDADDRSD